MRIDAGQTVVGDQTTPIFDGHLHIIDERFPLTANAGYLPRPFTAESYLAWVEPLGVVGGAVVSGSFQACNQDYLVAALARLGPSFVGVTQLPPRTGDDEIRRLHDHGVRALRFNLRRGMHPDLRETALLARRAFDIFGWHTELYVDGVHLPDLTDLLDALPAIVIDHLGLTAGGVPYLLRQVERGVRVKASGFGRDGPRDFAWRSGETTPPGLRRRAPFGSTKRNPGALGYRHPGQSLPRLGLPGNGSR
jgi:hypothetical protein